MNYPLILSHIYKERVWGGSRLKKNDPPIGEDWVLSVRDDDNSIVVNGDCAGKKLSEVLGFQGKFPLLIKFIDSKETLSIQVHPDDETAALMGGEGGKTEMWYIIDAEPDAYIYYGIKDGVDEDILRDAILSGDDPTPFLRKVHVKPGDCYFIPGGTPHAIGGGIYLCEIQQNCDTTFRMYDYGRPRELHPVEAALSLRKAKIDPSQDNKVLASCDYFTAELLSVDGEIGLTADSEKFISLSVVKGEAEIGGFIICERDSVILPAGEEKYTVKGNALFIKTTI